MAPLHRPRIPQQLTPHREFFIDDGRVWDGIVVDCSGDDEEGAACDDVTEAVADDVELVESTFLGVRFTGSNLRRSIVRDCRFERCELSGVVFDDAAFARVEFIDCRLSGAVLAGSRLRHVRFDGCRLDGVNLRMAAATPVAFHGCQLVAADFYGADLAGAELLDCDLTGAGFSRAGLAGSRLHGSELADVIGGDAFRSVEIDDGQLLPMALAIFGGLDIRVTER